MGKYKWLPRPSEELGYVLGILKGDGCTYYAKSNNSYRICLVTTNIVFALSFKTALEKIGLRPEKMYVSHPKSGSRQKSLGYIVRANCKDFYIWYNSLDVLKFVEDHNLEIAFLRGFYESEGGIRVYSNLNELKKVERRKNKVKAICQKCGHIFWTGINIRERRCSKCRSRKVIVTQEKYLANSEKKYCYIHITNTDYNLIVWVKSLLERLGFHPKIYLTRYNHKNWNDCYQLRIFKQDEVKKFLEVVRPCIKTKPN